MQKSKPDLVVRGQPYWQIGTQDYERPGRPTVPLIVLQTYCPECGRPFETATTPTKIKRGDIHVRRCPEHRQGRVPVKKLSQEYLTAVAIAMTVSDGC